MDNGDRVGLIFLKAIFQIMKIKSRRINDLRKQVECFAWWERFKNNHNIFLPGVV